MSSSIRDPWNLPRRVVGRGGGLIYVTHGNEFSSDVGIERSDHFKTLLQL